MSTVRLKRLTADFDNLSDYVRRHPRLRIVQADGDPPARYQLEFRVKSLRKKEDQMTVAKKHLVEIALPRNYPRTPPQCRMLTPVFHPNIAPHAICVGDHWSAGESLESIVIRIGEMLAYQVYNVKSPLNGDAARWVDEHEDELPLDEVSMLAEDPSPDEQPDEDEDYGLAPPQKTATKQRRPSPEAKQKRPRPAPAAAASAQTQSATAPRATDGKIVVACGSCAKRYRVPAKMAGRTAKCQNCEAQFALTPVEG